MPDLPDDDEEIETEAAPAGMEPALERLDALDDDEDRIATENEIV